MRRSLLSVGFGIVLVLAGATCAPRVEPPPKKNYVPPVVLDEKPHDGSTEAALALLRKRVDAALDHVHSRDVLRTHNFWAVFHAILGMGPEATYVVDPETKQKEKAIDYIRRGQPLFGLEFKPATDGLDVVSWPGTGVGQGHQDQFIAEMVQWGLGKDLSFKVADKDYKFEDFVRFSKQRASLKEKQELEWAVVIIAQHYGTNYSWTNNRGEQLSVEDIMDYEVKKPIDKAACGGTHRLFGLTWAYHLHRQNGGEAKGVWKDTAAHLAQYKEIARSTRSADGSFSTKWFAKPENLPDPEERIRTTGHILEWLAMYLPDQELKADWMQDAAHALAKTILENTTRGMDMGALYHAAHGLHIYRTRVFGPTSAHPPVFPPIPKD